ncbi:alpha/beta hydrolase [Corynebacterium urinipleomorphum]|uniref:alpha/beta hydrolase n=1 Tax=Corynebacterium urinipleomorphum TaxID=1852380 RepID=UPI001F3E8A52|nr:alpha/beta hydrolase family protein [Corynebacterium urinipleomorphum]
MKFSRPALAAVAAIAVAAGSFSIVNAADKRENTTADRVAANSPRVGDAAPINPAADAESYEFAEDAEAADADLSEEDAVADDYSDILYGDPIVDATADADVAADVAYEEASLDDGAAPLPASPSEVDGAVATLSQPAPVDPTIEARAQEVPDLGGNKPDRNDIASRAKMRKMTGPSDAPKKIYGDTGATQAWYGTEGVEGWYVYSESMKRDIPVALIRATDRDGNPVSNAPTLYMLNGAGGAEQDGDWISTGGAQDFYRGKGVNVVIPMEGAFSYYVDWLTDGETLKQKSPYFKGEQKWSTFLGKELPPAVEHELGANDKRGVLGFSMSGTSSLLLAEHFPDQFTAVGSFSGCAATSTPLPWAFTALTVNRAARKSDYTSVTPAHIWGPMGSPYNRHNDALVNAEKLRDKAIYISNGSGTGSQSDMIGYRMSKGQDFAQASSGSLTTTVEGGVIEAATNACTHDLRAKLNNLNIPAHYEFRKTGTHAWSVWIDDLGRSWNTTFGPALIGDSFVRADAPALDRPTWNPGNK